MPFITVTEGAITAKVPAAAKVSKEMEVFYNPAMKLNRDISVLLLRAFALARKKEVEKGGGTEEKRVVEEKSGGKKEAFDGLIVGSPLAGSGIRECRFLVELEQGLLKAIEINDHSEDAVALIRENIERNERLLNCQEIEVSCDEANKFLLASMGFFYIDIDPFGTPNPFLDAAVKRMQRGGILAVTATDTSALSGTYADACRRKYWAEPMRNHLMHEIGLRILVRKVQLIGAQYEKSLTPIYSYSKEHYMRIFLRCEKHGRKEAAAIIKLHKYLHYCNGCLSITTSASNAAVCCGKATQWAGPLWIGQLWDASLARELAAMNKEWEHGQPENQKFLETVAAEASAPASVIGFYPFNLVRNALGKVPKRKSELLNRKGVWPTHFLGNAVKVERTELLF